MLIAIVLGLGLAVGGQGQGKGLTPKAKPAGKATRETPKATGVADKVTLRDGNELLGSIREIVPRGPVVMVLRRDWARVHAPSWYEKWHKQEKPLIEKAAKVRIERLKAWKDQRQISPEAGDRILSWIDRELDSLKTPDVAKDSVLILAKIPRNEIKAMTRQPRVGSVLLQHGWTASLREPEGMSPDSLTNALEGKGFLVEKDRPASIDHLLPLTVEAETQWLLRRAATEVASDTGNRLLRYQDSIMPEPAPGEAPPAGAGISAAVGAIKELLGEPSRDPVPDALRNLTKKGKTGAIITKLTIAPDLDSIQVERTLWVRAAGDTWMRAAARSSTVRPGDVPAQAGQNLAADPQISVAFSAVETLGLGQVSEEMKQKALNAGAATKMALGQARTAMDELLRPLALPVTEPPSAAKP